MDASTVVTVTTTASPTWVSPFRTLVTAHLPSSPNGYVQATVGVGAGRDEGRTGRFDDPA